MPSRVCPGGTPMTKIRTLPAHEIVRRSYPRPAPTEAEALAMAVGSAIDRTLSEIGHEVRLGRRPSRTRAVALADTRLREACEDAAVVPTEVERERIRAELSGMIDAYRHSAIYGLDRPRTRVILIDNAVGVYAQPDYWDGRSRFFEMKSYLAAPPPPDVALQLRLFQLAFPTFEAVLVCLDRHHVPVTATSLAIPPLTSGESSVTLRLARDLGLQFGQEKVLEYMEGPFARYTVPSEGTG